MSRPWSRAGLDLAVAAVLVVLAVLGFGPTFSGTGYLVAGLGGVALGLLAAVVGARWRLGTASVAALAVLLLVLAGGALTRQDGLLAGFAPTPGSLAELAHEATTSWKELLTTAPPAGSFRELLVVPLLTGWLGALLTATAALRARRAWLALLPAVSTMGGVVALGVDTAAAPLVQGAGFVVVALGWLSWRARTDVVAVEQAEAVTTGSRVRSVVAAAAVLAVAAGTGAAGATVLEPAADRALLREQVVPPLDLREYPSPLVGFRSYLEDRKDETVLTVSGLPAGARLRIASLDLYDGVVYDVSQATDPGSDSGAFTRTGEQVPPREDPPVGALPGGSTVRLDVQVRDYTGVWLPTLGDPESVRATGPRAAEVLDGLHVNAATGVLLSTAGLREGDGYSVDTVLAPTLTDEQIGGRAPAPLVLPEVSRVPGVVATLAAEWTADATTPLEQARALELALQEGFFSDGLEGEAPSRPGHGAQREALMLTAQQMVGDDEQYAVAMALMARALGMPARVVVGFAPDGDGSPVAVTGDDVVAWVEIAFVDAGWVTFDPTPDEDRVPQDQTTRPRTTSKPQVLQPPPPPQEPVDPPPASSPSDRQDDGDDDAAGSGLLGLVLRVVGLVTVPLVVVVLPLLAITAAKTRRRRRRATRGPTWSRVSGGWDEVLDRAADLGTSVPRGRTRRESAEVLTAAYPAVATAPLAAGADAGVFAPGELTQAQVDDYWVQVRRTLEEMDGGLSRRQRWRARFSLRSFRSPRPRGGSR